MPKLTVEDLAKLRERARKGLYLRDGEYRAKVTVHMGTCGISAGARDIMAAVLDELERRGITDVMAVNSGCAGWCSREPMMTVEVRGAPPVKYGDLTPEKTRRIIEGHVVGGAIVREYALAVGSETVA